MIWIIGFEGCCGFFRVFQGVWSIFEDFGGLWRICGIFEDVEDLEV